MVEKILETNIIALVFVPPKLRIKSYHKMEEFYQDHLDLDLSREVWGFKRLYGGKIGELSVSGLSNVSGEDIKHHPLGVYDRSNDRHMDRLIEDAHKVALSLNIHGAIKL